MLNVLHISFHKGCQNDIEYLAKILNFNLSFMEYDDGVTKDGAKYNVTRESATRSWNKYKDFYNSFDCIITSDTAPISRVFLQNNWTKKLIIWICNRFDYAHHPDARYVGFPDNEYFQLINDVKNRKNVHIIGYTPFENYYTNHIRNLSIGDAFIKPIGKLGEVYKNFKSTEIQDKEKTFFIGPYHNDNIMMNLKQKVESLNIKVYNGKYDGPRDLAEFAGVIHIPYAWSNLALFEAIQFGIPYFIPSLSFFRELIHSKNNIGNFFWSPPYIDSLVEISEWYCPENKDIFIFFNSWDDLQYKVNNTDFNKHKQILKNFGEKHEKVNIEKWKELFLD